VRVLHVSAYFAPAFRYGGPPRSVLGLCKSLRTLGIDAEVLTTTADGPNELPPGRRDYEGVPTEYVPRSFPKRFFNAAGLRERLDNLLPSFDLLHVHGLWNMTVWKACAAARKAKKPYVISPRGMLDAGSMSRRSLLKRMMYPTVERRNLAGAAVLHASSEAEAEGFRRFDLPMPIKIVPNGVELFRPDRAAGDSLRTALGIAPDDPVAVYLGRIAPLKRLDWLAGAFSLTLKYVPNAKLLVVGPDEGGHLAAVKDMFAGIASAVRFLDEIDGPAKVGLFAAAQVLVCTSASESFGLSIAEALGAGVPAVVTDTCPWSVLNEIDAGRWVASEPTAVANAMIDLLSDPAKASAMGERGAAMIRERYSWDGVAGEMLRLYEEVTS
jgi:glycosyltransferase involved in cell wall biosynthesis